MLEGKKDTDKWFPIVLIDDGDFKTAETGKAFGDVTCKYSFEAATGLSTHTVTTNEWTEAGEGKYWLKIGASEFTSEGKYEVSLACAGCLTFNFPVEVRDKTLAESMDDIDTITTEVGKIPKSDGSSSWNATALAAIESEANDALVVLNLDHLMKTVVADADVMAEVVDNTVLANLMTKTDGDASDYDFRLHSLEAIAGALSSISNTGTAVNKPASSYTLTTGTQSANTVSSTEELDGTNHEHTNTNGSMDLYYEFIIGSGVPTTVIVTGYLNGNNDNLEVHGYDWVSTGWKQIGTLNGKAQSTNEVNAYDMFINMVGTGSDEGKVRVRFTDGAFTLTTATLAIDQIFVSFSIGTEGYDNGAIWINTNITNTNTVVGIDGTARNPVSTIAAANTLSAATNLDRFELTPGSSITFAADQENQTFNGENWTLALGGRSVSGSHILGADISGICTGATSPFFVHCHFAGAATLPPCHVESSIFENTITIGSAGDFFFERCQSGVAGTATPSFDFGSGLNASDVNFRDYSGGIEIQNMGAGSGSYNMSLEGNGQLTINSNCSATSTIAIRGNFTVTNNASGMTLSDDARYDIAQVETAVDSGLDNAISGPTASSAAYYLQKQQYALVNKLIITETNGNTEMFNDAEVSLGSIAAAFDSDGTYTTRKEMII